MMIIDKIAAFIGLSLLSVLLILHQGSELTKIYIYNQVLRVQTLNISKLYINNFNNNSKCNSLQDQKILNNSVLTKPYWLSFKRTSVSKTNKCTPTQYWHDS